MKTILVVEDDDSFREMMRMFLQARFNVMATANTGEALEAFACHDIAAVISDYHMPKVDGLAFCRAIRALNQRLGRHVPVWLMTGTPLLTEYEAIAAGAEGLFRKPFRVPDIAASIEQHLQVRMHKQSPALVEQEQRTAPE